MSFPKAEYVIHQTEELPKLGVVKFRPFLVGEHRRILTAIELGNQAAILNTICSVIKDCALGAVDVENTELYLLDKLYLDIFIKSKGAVSPATYTCNKGFTDADGDAHPCNTSININVPLDRAYILTPDGYKDKDIISLGEGKGIKLRQPTLKNFSSIASEGEYDITDEFIFSAIECMFDGDKITVPGKDFTVDQLSEYIETLPQEVMDQIEDFFKQSPVLAIDLPITCPSCGHSETIKLRGLDDFFA